MEAGGQMFKWSGCGGYWEPRPPRQPSSVWTWTPRLFETYFQILFKKTTTKLFHFANLTLILFGEPQRLLRCEVCELVQLLMTFDNLWLCWEATEDTDNPDHPDNHQAMCWTNFIIVNILASLYITITLHCWKNIDKTCIWTFDYSTIEKKFYWEFCSLLDTDFCSSTS